MTSAAPSPLDHSLLRLTPISAPRAQSAEIAELHGLLKRPLANEGPYTLVGPDGREQKLPESVFGLLAQIVAVLERGDAITLVPVGKELTTQQAANILNVSRQYVVRLLDDKRMRYHRTGTHRRIRMEDLLAYKRQRDRERMAALDDLSALSQDFGGYEELPDS